MIRPIDGRGDRAAAVAAAGPRDREDVTRNGTPAGVLPVFVKLRPEDGGPPVPVRFEQAKRAPASWRPPPSSPDLTADDVHVWSVLLDAAPPAAHEPAGVLSEDERARADRFVAERDRRRFVRCRAALRMVLGRYLGAPPAAVEFHYGVHGKPAVTRGCQGVPLCFNVTHAGGMALYAVALGREVGIDLERVQPDFPAGEVAARFFSSREAAGLRTLDPASRAAAFYRIWTRKEAYLKARGDGLAPSLREVEVSFLPGAPAALLTTPWGRQEASRWELAELRTDSRYVAAIAVEGRGWRLACRRWRDAHAGEEVERE